MKARWLILLLSVFGLALPVFAHRLDQYLQAITLTLQSDKILIQLHMTPGVSIASRVLGEIKPDSKEPISEPQKAAYAERVRRDLSLGVDGRSMPLHLVSFSFPETEEITNGTGEILLKFEADLPVGNAARKLTLENHHQNTISAFLVNTLVPEDPRIHVLNQRRNYNQSFYQLDFAVGDIPLRTEAAAPTGVNHWLQQTGNLSVFESYFAHGVHHILTGYDHLLFICALVLGAATLWDLIKVVTAFTLAHSATLALAAFNLVHLPGTIVEPLISASIVFVAVQNIFWPSQTKGWSRLGVAFFFGLFHGLGFAGGLLDAMSAMPGATMMLALVGFSIGVECGHQLVVLPLFAFLQILRRSKNVGLRELKDRGAFQQVGSALISVAGCYYLFIALK
jgi:hydrogenase/urease accessory protein HupE